MKFLLLVTILWIITFFIVLPISNQMPKNIIQGHADSAPEKHYLIEKLLISLVLSIILALCYKVVLHKFPQICNLMKY